MEYVIWVSAGRKASGCFEYQKPLKECLDSIIDYYRDYILEGSISAGFIEIKSIDFISKKRNEVELSKRAIAMANSYIEPALTGIEEASGQRGWRADERQAYYANQL